MKVLDEKGRLFGKINLVDLLVIVVIIAVIAAVIWKVFGDNIEEAVTADTGSTLTYEVVVTGIDNEICETVAADYAGQMMSNGELIEGYVIDCQIEPYYVTDISDDGTFNLCISENKSNLRFVMVATLEKGDIANTVGSQEVRIGKSHIVKTCDIELTGTVTALEVTEGEPDYEALGVTG